MQVSDFQYKFQNLKFNYVLTYDGLIQHTDNIQPDYLFKSNIL